MTTASSVSEDVRTPKAAQLILGFLCFAPQFYFGFAGSGLLTPLGWSLGMALFAVGTGWRVPQKGIATSVLVGTCYGTAFNVPIYLVGRWIGDPASSSAAFTAVAALLGLATFGSLIFVRRIVPSPPPYSKSLPSESARTPVHETASVMPQVKDVFRFVRRIVPSPSPNSKFLPSESARTPVHETTGVTPQVKDVFRKLHRLMDNEKAQNERLAEPFRTQVRRGADCDEIAEGAGEFGRDPRNPIPVNGPLGELLYLSNLRTTDSQQIMFHRLGSLRNVAIYEIVTLDGAVWDILFLHPYHPRKSRRSPSGYQIVTGDERNTLVLGVNDFVVAFPERLSDAIATMSERIFRFRIRPPQVREALVRSIFQRPTDHLSRLNIILDVLKRQG